MKYLIIGSEGFLGKALCELLCHIPKAEIIKVDRTLPEEDSISIARLKIDLISDIHKLVSLCKKEKPSVIFNLAGTFSASSMQKMFELNCFAPIRFLEAVANQKFKVILVGSAAEYGITDRGKKASEDFALRPISDYGISKACQTFMALRFAIQKKFPNVVIARSFNIIGPGISGHLFFGAFAKQIVEIENSIKPPIMRVGNLYSYRDILPVEKVVDCLKVLADYGRHGEVYNVCSGRPVQIAAILRKLLKLSKDKIEIQADRNKCKAIDIPWSVGDNAKISQFINLTLNDNDLNFCVEQTLNWFRDKFKK